MIINVYGTYQSGKSLLYDAFSSSDCFCTFDKEFDFDIIRYPTCLLDLYRAILSSDPLISGHAYCNFSRTFTNKLRKPRNLLDAYLNYCHDFSILAPGFRRITSKYLHDLRQHSRQAYHPFQFLLPSSISPVFIRTLTKLGLPHGFLDTTLLSISEADFLSITKDYMDSLFSDMKLSYDSKMDVFSKAVVINNACFPGQESLLASLYPDLRNILVVRHPKTTYIDITKRCSSLSYKRITSAFIDLTSYASYLDHFELQLSKAILSKNCHVVRFEDLLAEPEETLSNISNYLGVPPSFLRNLRLSSTHTALQEPLSILSKPPLPKDSQCYHYTHTFYPDYAA